MTRCNSLLLRAVTFAAVLSLTLGLARAQAPPGYYSSVDATNGTTLRSTLHAVIDDHQRFPYTASSTDTWDILNLADEDPGNSNNILDIYRNSSIPKIGGGIGPYNREHSWPKSYGFPDDGSGNYPFTDCHQLFLCEESYNSVRSNKPFRDCDAGCNEKPTDFNFGRGGGSGFYPGNSNWTEGSFTTGSWEVWSDRRGDIARAMFYMDVRYEGGTHNGTGAIEPNLILTDNESLIASSNTGGNESVAYMGILSVLLQWHSQDPVDSLEMMRNDVVFGFQGNRNPFVDHPEWVDCIFNGVCGPVDMVPPAAPTGLSATATTNIVMLDWNNNSEPDLAGYRVYRSTTSGGPYGLLSGGLVLGSAHNDLTVVGGVTYYYVVTAQDTVGNESSDSLQAFATPTTSGGAVGDPWINELHYDNVGGDTGEFVELAGPADLDLDQWNLALYNGNGSTVYFTVPLSGIFPDQGACIGTLATFIPGLQNGAPDGIALVDPMGQVVEFISYEGTILGSGGPADGVLSTDIGVSEATPPPAGQSLQRAGTGASAGDFVWQNPQADNPGSPNSGQTFAGGCPPPMPPAAPVGIAAFANDGSTDVSWSANSEPDLTGYNVYRSLVPGSGYAQLNGALLGSPLYHDAAVVNGTTYYYRVTAENSSILESLFSSEAQATPSDMTAPASPTGLSALGSLLQVQLDWDNNLEPDLAGYNVYRSVGAAGPYVKQNRGPLIASEFQDAAVAAGTEYFYRITALDLNLNESAPGFEANATPFGPPVISPWINEVRYLSPGRQAPQGVELAGDAGVDLTGWKVVSYANNGTMILETFVPAGVLPDLSNGLGVRFVPIQSLATFSGGLALVDDLGVVRQFLSYNAKFVATNGPAVGLEPTSIGAFEDRRAAQRESLQLVGTGSAYFDFTWQSGQASSFGLPNEGQVLQP